jgi:hypothetical protein
VVLIFLNQLAQKQEMVIEKYGPYNPLVDLQQYRATLAQIIQLSGFQDPSQFVKEVTPEAVQQFMSQMSENKTPDPAEMLAKVEADKTKADIVINAAKQELDRQKAIADADLKRDQLMADFMLRAYEIQAKYGTQIDVALIKAELDSQRADLQATFAASPVQVGI